MSDELPKPASEAERALEREIRADRKFSLAEAIGRMAGPGAMKGISPVTGLQQAELAIKSFLERHLTDSGGVLQTVLLRQVQASDVLLNHFDQPLGALASHVRRVLDSEYLLKELVREADVEWGRVNGERPHFEKEGRSAHPDDPYTVESVCADLTYVHLKLHECTE